MLCHSAKEHPRAVQKQVLSAPSSLAFLQSLGSNTCKGCPKLELPSTGDCRVREDGNTDRGKTMCNARTMGSLSHLSVQKFDSVVQVKEAVHYDGAQPEWFLVSGLQAVPPSPTRDAQMRCSRSAPILSRLDSMAVTNNGGCATCTSPVVATPGSPVKSPGPFRTYPKGHPQTNKVVPALTRSASWGTIGAPSMPLVVTGSPQAAHNHLQRLHHVSPWQSQMSEQCGSHTLTARPLHRVEACTHAVSRQSFDNVFLTRPKKVW